jgi:hypothetical protein
MAMRLRAAVTVVLAGLLFASAALAASSPPVAGGRYKGTDDSKSTFKTSRSVTLQVTKNRANFAHGRFNLALKGRGGLGSCAGQAFVTLSPTKVRQISRRGTFNLHGRFVFKVLTPYGPSSYRASVSIRGAFSSHGRKVAGTLRETAASKGLTCRSGTVHFRAALV